MTDIEVPAESAARRGLVPLQLTLNPADVSAPTHQAVTLAAHVIGACLRAFARDDLCAPDLVGSGLPGVQFKGFDLTIDQRREAYSAWLLSKAFQELARGLRESLEQAFLFLEFLRMPQVPTTWEKLLAAETEIRERAQKCDFAKLLSQVNVGLSEPLAFEIEFLSLQKVRNCLEHRAGIVGDRDIKEGETTLKLRFPFVEAFAVVDGREVEIPWGQTQDTHDINSPLWIGRDRTFYVRRVDALMEFRRGEAVKIEPSDFARIAMACMMFASDLASKIPQKLTGSQ